MADAGTIARIDGIMKNTYGPKVVEQQNLTAFSRKRYGKADNEFFRAPGNHFEFPARIGGNRAGIAGTASDDPILPASRQQEKKFTVYDRGYSAPIAMFEKDIDNAKGREQSFISHQEDEMMGITNDTLKVMNIDLVAGDGSGVLSICAAGVNSATQTLAVGTGAFQYGSAYIQQGDVVDYYDPTLTTSRTGGAGLTVNSITPSTGGGAATIVLSGAVTTTTGDILTRGPGRVNKVYSGFLSVLHNQGTTFQGLSTTTYPKLAANRINANGQPLTEGLLRSAKSVVARASGKEIDEFLAGFAQFDAYEALGFAQKRFDSVTLDKGFEKLKFGGTDFIKDVDVPSAMIYGLKRDTIKFGEVTALGFGDLDGKVLKWVQNYMKYTAYLREFGNMLYTNPNQLVIIDTLNYALNNPAYAQ